MLGISSCLKANLNLSLVASSYPLRLFLCSLTTLTAKLFAEFSKDLITSGYILGRRFRKIIKCFTFSFNFFALQFHVNVICRQAIDWEEGGMHKFLRLLAWSRLFVYANWISSETNNVHYVLFFLRRKIE